MLMMMPPMPPRSHLVDDFANRAAGSLVGQGWTAIDGTTAVTFTVQSDAASISGRSVVVDKTSSDGFRGLAFDAAGSPSDVEVLTRVAHLDTLNQESFFVSIRVSGVGNNSSVWTSAIGPSFSDSDLRNKLNLAKEVSGTTTSLDDAAFTPVVGTSYWIRIRGNGSSVSAKIWEDGTSEPAFQVSGTAASPASGVITMGIFETTDDYSFDYFSVGLAGATAPGPTG